MYHTRVVQSEQLVVTLVFHCTSLICSSLGGKYGGAFRMLSEGVQVLRVGISFYRRDNSESLESEGAKNRLRIIAGAYSLELPPRPLC